MYSIFHSQNKGIMDTQIQYYNYSLVVDYDRRKFFIN